MRLRTCGAERGTDMGIIGALQQSTSMVSVLIMLITLSVSMVAIILAAVAMSQAARAAKSASEAGGPALTEGDKRKLSEAAGRVESLSSQMAGLETRVGETAGRLDKLGADLDAARSEIRENATGLAEANEDLVHFREFKNIVEETHRRLSGAFSFTQELDAEDMPVEQDGAHDEGDSSDSDDYQDKPAGGADDPIID
jgi:hypothetical protein